MLQNHAFFVGTQWDYLPFREPPFVPALEEGDEDTYFPSAWANGAGLGAESDGSEASDGSCSCICL